ncbi:HUS1 checkpoint protein [Monoraphidium neglectum]|uniref:HUS1 checkpoint protein n=1 Tax=Monoraphidium neglectum TaxID=145388 RepID=A0A0D2MNC8_9CHLO|nr:HUS1 checkpoint protein [Monoraphidium neglectum]KIY96220.1 HUS1 checkpoint protein [Monoraphidium neglectum]|eukprot:XP_013895240.1 HUS1 checkpoint protein [Monoraphidium neglectum]
MVEPSKDVLFEPGTFNVQSRHHNLIAFSVDVGLLLKVLRSASGNDTERLEVKLVQKSVAMPGQEEPVQMPFMSFTARGTSVCIVQDLPISKPFTPSEIDRVAAAKSVTQYAPVYLDLSSGGPRLQAVIERLKSIGPVLRLGICKNGDLHIQVSATNVMLGAQLQGLSVMPPGTTFDPAVVDRAATAEEQLQAALDAGEATSVVKHIAKVLGVSQLSTPHQILCGISSNKGHVHVMFIFRDPTTTAAFDDSLELGFKLPIRADEDEDEE